MLKLSDRFEKSLAGYLAPAVDGQAHVATLTSSWGMPWQRVVLLNGQGGSVIEREVDSAHLGAAGSVQRGECTPLQCCW